MSKETIKELESIIELHKDFSNRTIANVVDQMKMQKSALLTYDTLLSKDDQQLTVSSSVREITAKLDRYVKILEPLTVDGKLLKELPFKIRWDITKYSFLAFNIQMQTIILDNENVLKLGNYFNIDQETTDIILSLLGEK